MSGRRSTATRESCGMKAIIHKSYGDPSDVLIFGEAPQPPIGADDVLIRVRASSINPADVYCVTGQPYMVRAMFGLRGPARQTPGLDVAGTVEAIGVNVTDIEVGDNVFAESPKPGTFAEFAAVPAEVVAPMPEGLLFEDAAAVPLAGCTALQALRDNGKIRTGQQVLINGASGGVGTFAVQLAKSMGATVTGVCSDRNVALVESLGADAVIDYSTDDFTAQGQEYDVIIDLVGNRTWSECKPALAPKGRLVMCAGGGGGRWLGPVPRILKTMTAAGFSSKQAAAVSAQSTRTDLIELGELLASGALRAAVTERYPLSDVADAIAAQQSGHRQGKTVITV